MGGAFETWPSHERTVIRKRKIPDDHVKGEITLSDLAEEVIVSRSCDGLEVENRLKEKTALGSLPVLEDELWLRCD
ncbi:hypothetical protein E2C01_065605 [Portunus trituberculatus]|uniref:Uncharacterized protein n=1 Tax=Portunus trituberculatus TaxID=210409 RepID=A0A5B7HNP0_PORTR|nr:hypothetical protein [Portunus trituberculatus]